MENKRILIIEDEETISDILSYSLKKEGYHVKVANNGGQGISDVDKFKPHVILLDLMLPDISGFEVCKSITRNHIIPVVMLTAKSDTVDKILGLEFGADDYITKPFDVREVTVRIKAILRRIELTSEYIKNSSECLKIGNSIKIFRNSREVLKSDNKIELTNMEYELLLFLTENRNSVFSRTDLLDKVWGFDFIGDSRTVDIHIQRLRKKLDEKKDASIIKTIFGVGYKII